MVKIEKDILLDTIYVEILSVIDNWSISFENNDKHIDVMNQIIQKKPVLNNIPYTKLKPFHNFVPLSCCGTTRYDCAHRNYINNVLSGPKLHLTKNEPA